jgi:hypothetical protein
MKAYKNYGGILMKKEILCAGLAVALVLFIFAPPAGAQMTGPFLLGEWEVTRVYSDAPSSGYDTPMQTQFKVFNATTVPLDVFVVLLDRDGNPAPTCYRVQLSPNATWKPCWPFYNGADQLVYPYDWHHYGAAKFFAFPANTLKFDPNAVITGFQQKTAYCLPATETLLPAVTINSKTMGEFTKYPLKDCQLWQRGTFHCSDNCGGEPT